MPGRSKTESETRRERGSYYTPRFVVDYMLRGCLKPAFRASDPVSETPLRILDPACGDGAFLLEAFDWLHDWYLDFYQRQRDEFADRLVRSPDGERLSFDERLRIVREQLFGVDIDPSAVAALRSRLRDRIGVDVSSRKLANKVIEANIRCGDALTGADFSLRDEFDFDRREFDFGDFDRLDFRDAFPQVAKRGGFDLVIGNPPYRRELNAKPLFDRIAASPLGRKWRQARMDLWYYFLHRGLDLLHPGGRLSFIVNSYWTASTGARRLIDRLERETTLEEVVLLGDAPVFPDVAGRHLIFRLRTGCDPEDCRVIDLSAQPATADEMLRTIESPFAFRADAVSQGPCGERDARLFRKIRASATVVDTFLVPQRDLFRYGQISLQRPDPVVVTMTSRVTLGELFEVRQGMAENPPSISARLNREFGSRYCVGEGVFVLTSEEVEELGLSPRERKLLRPYYRVSELGRYAPPEEPTRHVLYLTRRTAAVLEDFPRVRQHLDRFRPIMHRRRETRKGIVAWWQLHWPREERLFTTPRLLAVQMGRRPQFCWATRPTYVGFSVNLILAGSPEAFELPTLCGVLNSSLARRWFTANAKRRGVNLEINGKLLKRFPLPIRDAEIEHRIAGLVTKRQAIRPSPTDRTVSDRGDSLERSIDELVYQLYGVRFDQDSP